ncbi:MAG: glucosaminidase domain-containing protein, partial [Clostridia bacterium]|nr:glucosaminidase domain-containing protein [Clostridia bacterium]
MTKQEFFTTLGNLAVAESNRRIANGSKFVLPSVCIGQSALETGYGSSGLMVKANAFFGIKAGGSWTGKVYTADTWEVADGVEYNTSANFRAYDNLQDSVAAYYELIINASRYRGGLSTYPNGKKS